MIPKKIHYCWFSGKQIPKEFQGYIDSWKKFCPDYEIIRWDESNYDISQNGYMESAYKEKRWGFVPDYARFDILYREGGIYLDTDVELIKSLDPLLDNPCFFGFEDANHINPGLGFGAEAGNPVILALREIYRQLSFYKADGALNLIPSPEYVTRKLEELGVEINGQFQELKNVTIYPREFLGAKNYNTGKINQTENTYAIHHFSCTWMTREEKKAEERRKLFCARYGNFLGNRIDGVCKRVSALSKKRKKNSLPISKRITEHFVYSEKRNYERMKQLEGLSHNKEVPIRKIALLSPAIDSDNLGDCIIEEACIQQLDILRTNNVEKVSTHWHPTKKEIHSMKQSDVVIAAGSNLLGADVNHSQWKLPRDFTSLSELCLMGCGWSNYEQANHFSNAFYEKVLNNGWIHSVRDRYTEEQLKRAGVKDVLYTGCPSMWNLTGTHVSRIPTKKSQAVVTALTSYQSDYEKDFYQMQVLLEQYERVYFWPQGTQDETYLSQNLTENEKKRIFILRRDLDELKTVLQTESVDYVGNRLHAGILALNMGRRSCIIAIDNRAIEIGKDTGLPVIPREEIEGKLESWINGNENLSIQMPWENIARWKNQFKEAER